MYLYIDPADQRLKQKNDAGDVRDLTLGDGSIASASNQGGGVGVFDNINSADLELRSLTSPSGKVTVVLNAGAKEVELGVALAAGDVGLGNVTNDAQLKRAAGDFAVFTEKTSPVITDVLLLEDSNDAQAKKKVQLANILPVFGREYAYAESLLVDTVTAATFFNKVTLDVQAQLGATLEGGTYRVAWGYQWNLDSSSENFLARVQLDGVDFGTFPWLHVQEPKDSGGNDPPGTGSSQRHTLCGQRRFVFSAGATPTFTLDFQPEDAGTEASMWNAYIEFWRVA